MRMHRLVLYTCLVILIAAAVGYAQMVTRPYRNGSVWTMTFVHTHSGMTNAYMTYLTTDWKREQEALKQQGMILSYKVLTTESHTGADWDVLLMTEYKDLASLEANQDKADALAQKVIGDDQRQMQGYKDRSEIREVMGDRLAREIVLEPKP